MPTSRRLSGRGAGTAPRLRPVDIAVAAVCAAPTLVSAMSHESRIGVADVAVAVVSVALVVARRAFPLPAFGAGVIAMPLSVAVLDRPNGLIPTVIVLLFTVSARSGQRVSLQAGAVSLLALVAAVGLLSPPALVGAELLAALAWPLGAVAGGEMIRSHAATIAAMQERARLAEAGRVEEARRKVIEERLHIARELHDVVAHRLAIVTVQAGVADHFLRAQPDDAAAALAVVRSSAQAALNELGSVLGVLRAPDDADASVVPAPADVGALSRLIESYRAAGLQVEYETSGEPRTIADTTQLAIYRTVQEALTNAHKYGDGRVRLSVCYRPDGVDLDVRNALGAVRPAPPPSSGFGLSGMRERVVATGGTLEVGRDGSHHFAVRAHFPVLQEQL